jgi:hypothetical protein
MEFDEHSVANDFNAAALAYYWFAAEEAKDASSYDRLPNRWK